MTNKDNHEEPKLSTEVNHKPKLQYNSNPFTLGFEAFSKFMHFNLGWGIALITIALLNALANMLRVLVETMMSGDPANAMSITQNVGSVGMGLPELGIILAVAIIVFIIVLVSIIAGVAIGSFLAGMFNYVALQSIEGHKVSLNEAIDAVSKRFRRLFLSNLLATLKIIGWTMLFVVPGIIASLRYALLNFVIMDEPAENKDVKSSHDSVKLLTRGRLMEVFGIATVGSLIPFVGSAITTAGNGALYRQLQVYGDNNLEKPKIHWLNYTGIILIGVAIALISLLLILILLISVASS